MHQKFILQSWSNQDKKKKVNFVSQNQRIITKELET